MLSRYDIAYECLTHRGLIRANNEDNYLCAGKYLPALHIQGREQGRVPCGDRRALFAVFDGIGGEAYGEESSCLAARTGEQAGRPRELKAGLPALMLDMNRAVCSWAREEGVAATGSTVVMAAFTNREAVFGNLGDSRLYLFRQGSLRQLSEDHTLILPGRGKGMLTQCLGMDSETEALRPFVAAEPYLPGDLFLLCSDGLTDMLSDAKISAGLCENNSDAATWLLDQALAAGGHDNITLMLLRPEKRSLLTGLTHH